MLHAVYMQATGIPAPKFIHIERSQTRWGEIDVESLIEADHPARAIWSLTGRLDLSSLEGSGRSMEGKAGAPRHSPRLLMSVWIYAYSQGIASARAIERMMSHEPGLRWLCGDEPVNHHTLSDFRVGNLERLRELFSGVLAVMAGENLLDLTTLMVDGTKMQAVASKYSFQRRGRLQKHLAQAQALVEELEQQSATADSEPQEQKRRERKQRQAVRKVERMEKALEELEQRQSQVPPSEQDKVRVSRSEPEARVMKQNDGGWAPCYNTQLTTEAKSAMVVNVDVVQAVNDQGQLLAAIEQASEQCAKVQPGAAPERMVADCGYVSRKNVEQSAGRNVQLIGPWKEDGTRSGQEQPLQFIWSDDGVVCPAGQKLVQIRQGKHHGLPVEMYESRASDCKECEYRQRCLKKGKSTRRMERVLESAAMQQYLARQQDETVQALYSKRKQVAEFPQLRFKGNWRIRRFVVRGLEKVKQEVLWIAMAYNVTRWMYLSRQPVAQAA